MKKSMKKFVQDTQDGYDAVSHEYAERFKDEMDDKPFDRDCLDRLAREVGALGPICDLGCGPGQIARYLYRQRVKTLGVDLSTKMVEEAQKLNPEIHFHQGDMLSLPDEDNSWGGIAAFYSILHIPREQVVDALREMYRVLKPVADGKSQSLSRPVSEHPIQQDVEPASAHTPHRLYLFCITQPENHAGEVHPAGFAQWLGHLQ